MYPHNSGMCSKGERGGAAKHGILKMFSSSLMPMLVEAGLTHQVVPCFHTVVVCGVRGRGEGSYIAWDLNVIFQ